MMVLDSQLCLDEKDEKGAVMSPSIPEFCKECKYQVRLHAACGC